MLLPPDMRDWIPDNHMVHFLIDAVERFAVSAAHDAHPADLMLRDGPVFLVSH